jgi:heterodisulfide reductase subunit C
MREGPWARRIKYQSQLDPSFGAEIAEMARGENIFDCIQCGTCSGACPMSIYMDYTPRRIIAMTRAGLKREVLESSTIWLCASCYACTVECPKKIRITDVMYALKQKAMQEKTYPKRFVIPVMAREFFNIVRKNGRNSEARLIFAMYLKSNPFQHIKKISLGIKLWLKGRMGMIQGDSIKRKEELRAILDAVES